MLSYMEYIQRCFYSATGWDDGMSYEQILRTSNNILHFPISSGFKFSVSSKNTEYSHSSVTLSQPSRLTGSVSYLYSSVNPKENYLGSATVPLRAVLDDYRFIGAYDSSLSNAQEALAKHNPYLLYGKMYFPSQFLEGMVIKRLARDTQLMVKFINTPKLQKLANSSTIVTMYLKRYNKRCATDFIFSSNEALTGLRCLYRLGSNNTHAGLLDMNSLSLGFELWFTLLTMSPGMSTALRYSTHLSSSGKPLTMTLALNPLLGSIESTYAIKPALNATLSSKFSFNIYSYESDLQFGVSLLKRKSRMTNTKPEPEILEPPTDPEVAVVPAPTTTKKRPSHKTHHAHPTSSTPSNPHAFNKMNEEEHHQLLTTFMEMNPGKLMSESNARNFLNDFNRADFSSSFKCSCSLAKKDVRIAWEGRFKDLLLSSGVHLDCSDSVPKMGTYGLEVQYSS